MRKKELTPQQRWNHKHRTKLSKSSKKYYHKNRKIILRKLKVRYAKRKQLMDN